MRPTRIRAFKKAWLCGALLFSLASVSSMQARAAQTTIAISMAAPAAAPRILGAGMIGITPGTPILYTIPVTGTPRPTFTATGLTNGLLLNATTGQISGSIATAGQYPVTLHATSSAGSSDRELVFAAGDTLALTPPLGWNSYDSFDDSVTESEVLAQAQWQRDHFQPYGWEYVVVDFRWYDPGAPGSNQNQAGINNALVMDANGRFQPDPVRFPSSATGQGFTSLAAQVHALGLKFGIHIMRGIPRRAFQANSLIAGSTSRAQDAADTVNICPWNSDMYGVQGATAAGQAWYDSIFQQYAAWGIDFVKVDDITRNIAPINYHAAEVIAIKNAIAKSGRSIVLSLSPGQTPVANANDVRANANMWRMSDDFWDRFVNLDAMFGLGEAWQTITGAGHWPDADMLPFGFLGPRSPVEANLRTSSHTRFTPNEQVLLMSFWSILPSPMMLGANMVQSTVQYDAFMNALLTNEEVLAVLQDTPAQRGRLLVRRGTTGAEIWTKNLSSGRKAVGLFNRSAADLRVTASATELGISGNWHARDLWQRTDLGAFTSTLDLLVPWHSAALVLLIPDPVAPPDGGIGGGGAGGGAGASGNAGTPGSGTGGNAAAAGAASTADGGVAATGGSGGLAQGGTPGADGTAQAGATTSNSGAGPTNSGAGPSRGCACGMATSSSSRVSTGLLCLAFAARLLRRQRRARTSRLDVQERR